jgi:protocatechuate 3,4-dioxygenase beta subunit
MWPKDNNKQVSAAVRILQQKRDASARATHLKATDGIVSSVTIERKQMSTKTSFKRIALVAAAALAFGGVSVITATSANAAPLISYSNMYDPTNGYQVVGGEATIDIGFDSATAAKVVSSGVGTIQSATPTDTVNETLTSVTSTGFRYNAKTAGGGTVETVTVILTSAVVGTQTITVTPIATNGTLGTAVTKTVTWTASGTTSAASITLALIDSATAGSLSGMADSTVPLTYDKAKGASASVRAQVKDGNGNGVSGATVYVTVSGPGLFNAESGLTTVVSNTNRYEAVTTDTSGYVNASLSSDGTAGTSTIKFTVGSISATKDVTFSGSAASYATATGVGYLAVGANGTDGSSTSYALKVTAKDSGGGLVTSGSVYAVSSDKTVATISASLSNGTSGSASGITYWAITGIKAGTATITFQNTDPTGTTAATVTTTAKVEVTSSTANAVTLTFDKASYAPGEKGSVLVTMTNAAGRPVADGDYNIFAATGALTGNLQSQPNAAGDGTEAFNGGETTVTTMGGVATLDFYAPVTTGDFTVTATTLSASTVSGALTQAARALALSATATITGSADAGAALALDAANAATDAANNAYDEAQNATQAASDALAAVTTLAAQVKSLIASVKKLTAAVAKLKK